MYSTSAEQCLCATYVLGFGNIQDTLRQILSESVEFYTRYDKTFRLDFYWGIADNTQMRQITTSPLGCNKQIKRKHICKFVLHKTNYEKKSFMLLHIHIFKCRRKVLCF